MGELSRDGREQRGRRRSSIADQRQSAGTVGHRRHLALAIDRDVGGLAGELELRQQHRPGRGADIGDRHAVTAGRQQRQRPRAVDVGGAGEGDRLGLALHWQRRLDAGCGGQLLGVEQALLQGREIGHSGNKIAGDGRIDADDVGLRLRQSVRECGRLIVHIGQVGHDRVGAGGGAEEHRLTSLARFRIEGIERVEGVRGHQPVDALGRIEGETLLSAIRRGQKSKILRRESGLGLRRRIERVAGGLRPGGDADRAAAALEALPDLGEGLPGCDGGVARDGVGRAQRRDVDRRRVQRREGGSVKGVDAGADGAQHVLHQRAGLRMAAEQGGVVQERLKRGQVGVHLSGRQTVIRLGGVEFRLDRQQGVEVRRLTQADGVLEGKFVL